MDNKTKPSSAVPTHSNNNNQKASIISASNTSSITNNNSGNSNENNSTFGTMHQDQITKLVDGDKCENNQTESVQKNNHHQLDQHQEQSKNQIQQQNQQIHISLSVMSPHKNVYKFDGDDNDNDNEKPTTSSTSIITSKTSRARSLSSEAIASLIASIPTLTSLSELQEAQRQGIPLTSNTSNVLTPQQREYYKNHPDVVRVGSSSLSYHVYIKSFVSEDVPTRVKLNEYDHVEALKRRLSRKSGIPVTCQNLLYKGKILRTGNAKDNGLYPGCLITLCPVVETGLLDNIHGAPTAPLTAPQSSHKTQLSASAKTARSLSVSVASSEKIADIVLSKKKEAGTGKIVEETEESESTTTTTETTTNKNRRMSHPMTAKIKAERVANFSKKDLISFDGLRALKHDRAFLSNLFKTPSISDTATVTKNNTKCESIYEKAAEAAKFITMKSEIDINHQTMQDIISEVDESFSRQKLTTTEVTIDTNLQAMEPKLNTMLDSIDMDSVATNAHFPDRSQTLIKVEPVSTDVINEEHFGVEFDTEMTEQACDNGVLGASLAVQCSIYSTTNSPSMSPCQSPSPTLTLVPSTVSITTDNLQMLCGSEDESKQQPADNLEESTRLKMQKLREKLLESKKARQQRTKIAVTN